MRSLFGYLGNPVERRRLIIILAAVFVCAYALAVVGYVVSLPDTGVRSAFSTEVSHFFPEFLYPDKQDALKPGDEIVAVAGTKIDDWPAMMRRIVDLRSRPEPPATDDPAALADPTRTHLLYQDVEIVRIDCRPKDSPETTRSVWCRLGRSPLETLLPTVLWMIIKAGLFLVGALVYWKRPDEQSARMFFFLTVVSCAAYVGGYHWQGIVTQPALLTTFMVGSVLLPPVSLHFYLVFPHPKPFLSRRPVLTLTALYGPPVFFLLVLLAHYAAIRWLLSGDHRDEGGGDLLQRLLDSTVWWIYRYFVVAMIWYLASIVCLIHSRRTADGAAERNQVKWILFGAVAALMPMGYSLYLALLEQGRFSGGGATWPMFGASLCVTIAFTIAITRYRLMELDKLLSSGAVYLSLSGLAALVYYGLVIVGVLLLGSRLIAVPSLAQSLGVGGTVLVLVVLLDLARGRLKKALDRHFRREKLLLDRTLQRMSQATARLVDPPTLARRLLSTTSELLGIERGAVYLRDGDPPIYRLADSLGEPPPLTELTSGCPLVEELRERGRLCADEDNGGDGTPAIRQLRHLGGEAAFALAHEQKLLALLVLGRRGVDGYAGDDLNVLSAFTHVTALALLSSEGGTRIQALNRELKTKVEKIAEQQQRIFALQTQLLRKAESVRAAQDSNAVDPPAEGAPPPQVAPEEPSRSGGIIGSSPALRSMMHVVQKLAAGSSAVLIRGESGTGKELLARAVHEHSPRAGKPFLKVHCAALAPGLLESELFGHVKGAYTGAVRDRQGRFELADGGTLFLDEIGDVSWEVQTKLLRVLQEKTIERVGSSEPIQVDVRIIAATHQDLERMIQQGRFREDLFYRLNVLPIRVPPLRERREDIPELVQHFLTSCAARCGKENPQLDDEALVMLKSAPWPGNIRQLENVVERAVMIGEGSTITAEDLPTDLLHGRLPVPPLDETPRPVRPERIEQVRREREQLVRALAGAGGNKAEAARALGLKRSTLLSRLKKHGLT